MPHKAHVIGVLLCIVVAACGDSNPPPSTALPPIVTPISPTPPVPTQGFTLSGIAKEAWIDTGLPGTTVSIATGPSRGTTIADAEGRYVLANLTPGIYGVTFSRPAPYGSTTYSPVNVFADATFNGAVSLTGHFPVTAANLEGYWVAQGPYPYEPCRILIFQNGRTLQGWFKDGRDYSTSMSGTYAGDAVSIAVGIPGITIEGRVEDERCIRAVIKNEALGGTFPVSISRGGSCAR